MADSGVERKRKKRTLTITVDSEGRLVCKFRVGQRLKGQASYGPHKDAMDIRTPDGDSYRWLKGEI